MSNDNVRALRRRQNAVFWEVDVNAVPRSDGQHSYLDPIAMKVRWEDREEKVITDQNEEVWVRATVYVDRDMIAGGVLWLGLLVDAPDVPPATNVIKVYRKIPDRKARRFLRYVRI